jgi:hypothetical protein
MSFHTHLLLVTPASVSGSLQIRLHGPSRQCSLSPFSSSKTSRVQHHRRVLRWPLSLHIKTTQVSTNAKHPIQQANTLAPRFLAATEYPLLQHALAADSLSLPDNQSIQGLAGGIQAAFHAYPKSDLGHAKCVIFLVQDGERNIFDQRHLEYQVTQSSPTIPVFRLAISDILKHTTLADTPKRQLLYRLPRDPSKVFEVAVIYMRSGYHTNDYPDQTAWDARYHLERSGAIKCPSILTQLAGTKKVQQVLAICAVCSWKIHQRQYPRCR